MIWYHNQTIANNNCKATCSSEIIFWSKLSCIYHNTYLQLQMASITRYVYLRPFVCSIENLAFITFPFCNSFLKTKPIKYSPSLSLSFGILSICPLLPTIADSGIHRWVVVATLISGTIYLQLSPFSSRLHTKSYLNFWLWCSLLSQTLICVSEFIAIQPPG